MHTQTRMHTHSHSHTDPLLEPSVKTGLYCQVAWGTSQAWMRDVTILCDLSQGSDTFSLRCHCCCSKMMYLQALLLIFQNPLKTREGCLCSAAPFRSHQIDRPFLRDSEGEKPPPKKCHRAFSFSEWNNISDKEAELGDTWLHACCHRCLSYTAHLWFCLQFYEPTINMALWNLPIVNI